MKESSLARNSDIDIGELPLGITAHNGQSVRGEFGQLHIALRSETLRLHSGEPTPTHWLLPLDNPEVVRLSAHLPGDLLWLSPRRPQSLAGMLVGDFRGAWWEGSLALIMVQHDVELYFVPAESRGTGSLALLAQILALRWAGWPPTRIHAALAIVGARLRPPRSKVCSRTPELAIA